MRVRCDADALWRILSGLRAEWEAGKEQFRRVCLRELGRSPMQHLTSLRIERAQQLLDTTHDKIEAVAEQVGFENAPVFSRAFKRWVGQIPKRYLE